MFVIDKIIDFFFPRFCPVCGEVDVLLCDKCERDLGLASQICPVCNEESLMGWTHKSCQKNDGLDGLISLFEYGDPSVRKVVDSIKYDFNAELVTRLFEKIQIEVGIDFDFVVPVPLHYYRNNWRGFNQAELIGKALCFQIPNARFEKILLRKVNTVQQVRMANKLERRKNVTGVFDLNFKSKCAGLKGKNVLLVDDVFTTGSSMNECCLVLKREGARSVWGFVLAH